MNDTRPNPLIAAIARVPALPVNRYGATGEAYVLTRRGEPVDWVFEDAVSGATEPVGAEPGTLAALAGELTLPDELATFLRAIDGWQLDGLRFERVTGIASSQRFWDGLVTAFEDGTSHSWEHAHFAHGWIPIADDGAHQQWSYAPAPCFGGPAGQVVCFDFKGGEGWDVYVSLDTWLTALASAIDARVPVVEGAAAFAASQGTLLRVELPPAVAAQRDATRFDRVGAPPLDAPLARVVASAGHVEAKAWVVSFAELPGFWKAHEAAFDELHPFVLDLPMVVLSANSEEAFDAALAALYARLPEVGHIAEEDQARIFALVEALAERVDEFEPRFRADGLATDDPFLGVAFHDSSPPREVGQMLREVGVLVAEPRDRGPLGAS
ncbi:MAG: SMI1/KNR4 family protein [Polyangia bacterium]